MLLIPSLTLPIFKAKCTKFRVVSFLTKTAVSTIATETILFGLFLCGPHHFLLHFTYFQFHSYPFGFYLKLSWWRPSHVQLTCVVVWGLWKLWWMCCFAVGEVLGRWWRFAQLKNSLGSWNAVWFSFSWCILGYRKTWSRIGLGGVNWFSDDFRVIVYGFGILIPYQLSWL